MIIFSSALVVLRVDYISYLIRICLSLLPL